MRLRLSLLLLTFSVCPTSVFAWGERGHDAIARIAARLLANDENPEVAAWGKLLASKELMLGHLSNIPDIAWRRGGPEMDQLNSPSHFIDLEYMLPQGEMKESTKFPETIEDYKKRLEANCGKKSDFCAPGSTIAEKLAKAGHAPFRIQNLMKELTGFLAEVKKGQKDQDPKAAEEAQTKLVNQALLYTGVLAHFVGDLANPHHTSSDYDGWMTQQGGLHGYFESELVDAQDLALDQEVYLEAKRHHPMEALFAPTKDDALAMAWALVRESHPKVAVMTTLDRRLSLLKPSDSDDREKGKDAKAKREKAQRRAPQTVATDYRDFIVLRLAVGADALARFWKAAYLAGGKPDVSFFRSYLYPLDPAFIPLGYDVGAVPR